MKLLKDLRTRLSFLIRRIRIRLAVFFARPVDGMVASRVVYLRGTQGLADLMNKIDKSGILKGQPAKFAALERLVEAVTQDFVDAMKLGDPTLQMEEVRDVYVSARYRGMSKKQREHFNYVRGLEQLAARGEYHARQAPKQATPAPAPVIGPPPQAAVLTQEAPASA